MTAGFWTEVLNPGTLTKAEVSCTWLQHLVTACECHKTQYKQHNDRHA